MINIQNTNDVELVIIDKDFDKDFARKLDFKDIKYPVKIICVFSYENRQKLPVYISKNTFKRHADLLLIEKNVPATITS